MAALSRYLLLISLLIPWESGFSQDLIATHDDTTAQVGSQQTPTIDQDLTRVLIIKAARKDSLELTQLTRGGSYTLVPKPGVKIKPSLTKQWKLYFNDALVRGATVRQLVGDSVTFRLNLDTAAFYQQFHTYDATGLKGYFSIESPDLKHVFDSRNIRLTTKTCWWGLWLLTGLVVAIFTILFLKTSIVINTTTHQQSLNGDGVQSELAKKVPTVSLGKLQKLLWLAVVVWAYGWVWIIVGTPPEITSSIVAVLGISLATTLVAKGMDQHQIVQSEQTPGKSRHQEIKNKFQVLNDDSGITLPRVQIAFFQLLGMTALVVYTVQYLQMPELSAELLTLMGVSAAGYGVGKANENKGETSHIAEEIQVLLSDNLQFENKLARLNSQAEELSSKVATAEGESVETLKSQLIAIQNQRAELLMGTNHST
jgi:hypothetical protein